MHTASVIQTLMSNQGELTTYRSVEIILNTQYDL